MTGTLSDLVYLLCFLAAAMCAALLVRQYRMVPSRVLLWSAACFGFLAMSNLLVVFDRLLLAESDFRTPRQILTLLAVSVLLFGFIWEAEQDR